MSQSGSVLFNKTGRPRLVITENILRTEFLRKKNSVLHREGTYGHPII